MKTSRLRARWLIAGLAGGTLILPAVGSAQAAPSAAAAAKPKFAGAVAFDVSPALAVAAQRAPMSRTPYTRPEVGATVADTGFTGDSAVQTNAVSSAATVGSTIANFEGLGNEDNFNMFGFRVNPPDPNGEVGPNHFVEMTNLTYAVYDKAGTKLLGPADTGTLWTGFAVPDCTDPSGDPVVVYDQFADRWILSQFTTRGPQYYNCVAISTTGDPTGTYFRYAFSAGLNFPDYPKYGVWTD
ncbi:MAG: hypothetical protein ABIM89_16160, partial [Mycobacteriales bacterium]